MAHRHNPLVTNLLLRKMLAIMSAGGRAHIVKRVNKAIRVALGKSNTELDLGVWRSLPNERVARRKAVPRLMHLQGSASQRLAKSKSTEGSKDEADGEHLCSAGAGT